MLTFWQDKVQPLLQKRPGIALGIVGAGVIAVAIFAAQSLRGDRPRINTWSKYYTSDDGKSVFEDNDPHVAPFDHDGREAVQVYLIPGRNPGPESVWYLTKWSEEGKKLVEDLLTAPGPGKPPPPGAQLVKRPGDATWVPLNDPKAAAIVAMPSQ